MAEHIGTITKDPDDIRLETVHWSGYLNDGATISTASCPSPPSGITVSATTNDETTSTHTISGGVSGRQYKLTSRIVASDGEQLDLEFTVVVR